MLTVFVLAAPAGPATAREVTAARVRNSLRIVASCLSSRLPQCCPLWQPIETQRHSVLLRSSMNLRTPHSRALIAGGTGRVGAAIAARLRADGCEVYAAGRADGDLRTKAGAAALVSRATTELGALDLVVHAAGDGFAPKPVAEVTEEDWDAALDVTAK